MRDWDWEEARRTFERDIELDLDLDPVDAGTNGLMGVF
jgi:hypothetical protein